MPVLVISHSPRVAQDGDFFFVVMGGRCTVIRECPDTGKDIVLAQLSDGSYFGERALLKGERRYASVRADTMLQLMRITRQDFEGCLGPLADLVPDMY